MNEGVRLARIALHWLIEPGNEAVHRMVNTNGPVRALERLVEGDVRDTQLRGAAAARMAGGDPRKVAEAAIERADRLGARIVIPEDDEWPQPVRDLTKLLGRPAKDRIDRDVAPPLCLWVRGAPRLDDALARSVAVVGARAATHYGEHVATTLAYELAEREWTVVSGGAHGIDSAAHRGALNAGGLTVAVLACGVDKPYPSGNTGLFDRIAEAGLLISEWPPGSVPVRHRFLIRNRVIAAATRGTVVVEASARSGASQTLRRAINLGRRPMVVPGPVTSAMSVGCHELLREHPEARLVTGTAHVLEEIGRIGADLAPRPRGPVRPHDTLDVEAAMVLESVPRRGSAGPDELAAKAGLDIRTAMRKLTLLEGLGFIARRGGGYVVATKSRPSKASATPPPDDTTSSRGADVERAQPAASAAASAGAARLGIGQPAAIPPPVGAGALSAGEGEASAGPGAVLPAAQSRGAGATAAGQGEATASAGWPADRDGAASSGGEAASTSDGAPSAAPDGTSAEGDATSAGDSASSAARGATSAGRGAATAGDGAPSSRRGATAPGSDGASARDSATPAGPGATSAGRGAASADRDAASAGRDAASAGRGAALAGAGAGAVGGGRRDSRPRAAKQRGAGAAP